MSDVDPLVTDTAEKIFGGLGSATATSAWSTLRESGLPWLGIDEALGGEGGSLADAAAVIAVSARHPIAVPFADHWIAAATLAAAGITVPRGLDGPLTAAHDLGRVPYATLAAAVVTEQHGSVRLLAPSGSEPGRTLADEPRDAITPGSTLTDGPVAGPGLTTIGALVRSVQIAGALEQVLTMTSRYAGQRSQFGKPIAKFQAVAHLIAKLGEQSAIATMAADLGVAGALRGDWSQVAVAKAVCGEAVGPAVRVAHQAHGAIGVTVEYDLQAFTRRLLTWRDDHDAERHWQLRIGAQICDLSGDDLWRVIVGERPAVA